MAFPSVEKNVAHGETSLTCQVEDGYPILQALKSHSDITMNMLIDICGVDYLHYGQSEWETATATATGYGRGIQRMDDQDKDGFKRFAVVYHLLSFKNKERIRVKIILDTQRLEVESVVNIWPNASWYEREVYDLFGIQFLNHPDLRRILTDYGFIGHPFRKDFPLEGYVEMRYDAQLARCIYEPCEITPRVTVPKVIRDQDNRYQEPSKEEK